MRHGAVRGLDGVVEGLRILRESEVAEKPLSRRASIRLVGPQAREHAARADHRREQTARRNSVAEIEAIANDPGNAEMAGERPHDVVQPLAYKHDLFPCIQGLLQTFDAALLQLRLQDVLEIFLTEQIKAIATDAAQNGVQQTGGDHAIRQIKYWPGDRQDAHDAAPCPTLKKALRVPGEEADWTDCGEV